ncbi:mannan-binding family protein [Mycolicibacterium austroafricanum]|uniref:mannan-binding family protein n=1 Tax=Mycolicibacterium austroafricanum TaxID=39687 RepID=UPI001CA32733|nr:mannan-binding family protein [Mycolicibacterium austroafricanum]QZT59807.1 mannan-binding family protein [Mycolicibacterium austroafricanum]
MRRAFAAAAAAATLLATAPTASASVVAFCDGLGGSWNGQYCHTTVQSERNAVRDIKVAIPAELVDDPVAGPVVRDYLSTLVNNWKTVGVKMVADSYGEGNYQIFRRGDVMSAVFRETYHADGPDFNNAYRTFTFDMASGARLQLADLLKPGVALSAIPPLAHPFIVRALDAAPPPHQPGSYPFVADRWTPDKVYSGGYKAWALTPDELVIYMPDYPVGRDSPTNFTPGIMQWSMDGGTVQAHIPLAALAPILRPEFGGA